MEKLTIKELAPYLPYGLKLICATEGYEDEIKTLFTLSHSGAVVTMPESDVFLFEDIKPILRPLSDLTKEIKHNGEKFIPIQNIQQEYMYPIFWGENGVGKGMMKDRKMIHLVIQENEIALECPYFVYSKLIEWHFDVFGLIEKGLAIDVNKLSKNSL